MPGWLDELSRFYPWMPAAVVVYAAVIGAMVGSFLNVVIARLPNDESIVRPRSRCPTCRTTIRWYDNIPILSYALLRGTCRHCNTVISFRYATVELIMALLSAGLVIRLGFSWELLVWWPLTAALLAIAFLDIDHFWVPDKIVFPAMGFALGGSLLPDRLGILAALLGVCAALVLWAVGVVYEKLRGREGMGLGDIKLLAVVGLAMGLNGALSVMFLSAVQAAVIGSVLLFTGGHQAKDGGDDDDAPAAGEPANHGDAEQQDGQEEPWIPPKGAFPYGPFIVLASFQVLFLPDIFGNVFWRLGALMTGWTP